MKGAVVLQRIAVGTVAVAVGFGADGLARLFTTETGVCLWYPPAALTLVVFVLGGPRLFPLVVIARVASAIVIAHSQRTWPELVLVMTLVVAPYAAAAVIVRRHFRVSIRRAGLHEVTWTVGLCALAAPALAASGWILARTMLGQLPDDAGRAWLTFAIGDSVAVLGLAPGALLVVSFAAQRRRLVRLTAARIESAVAMAVFAATLLTAVNQTYRHDTPVLYIAFLPLLWIALRGGLRDVAAAALVGTAVSFTILSTGGLGEDELLQIQMFLIVLTVVGYGVGAEVSDRRRAERASTVAEARLRSAFDRSMLGMAMISLDTANRGRFLRVNDALCALLDRTADRLMSMAIYDLIPAEDRAAYRAALAELADRGGTVELTQRFVAGQRPYRWCRLSSAAVEGHSGESSYAIVQVDDVTLELLELQRLSHEATHDSLTGLYNRAGLTDAARGRLPGHDWSALLYVDLDNFKSVNDTFGHAVGDAVIVAFAEQLRLCVRDDDIVARLGGDEFAVLLAQGFATDAVAFLTASRVMHRIEGSVRLIARLTGDLDVGATGGLAIGQPGTELLDLIAEADQRMLDSKRVKRRVPG
jgi:diguanylate cyclase (GGDEF)-like protein/PAS domain S-box-containing protein